MDVKSTLALSVLILCAGCGGSPPSGGEGTVALSDRESNAAWSPSRLAAMGGARVDLWRDPKANVVDPSGAGASPTAADAGASPDEDADAASAASVEDSGDALSTGDAGNPTVDDAGSRPTIDDAGSARSTDDAAKATTKSDAAKVAPATDPKPDAAAKVAPATDPKPDAASGTPPTTSGLHAVGSKVVDSNGSAVALHGVSRSGSEFACVGGYGFFDGPTDAASIAAIKTWNVNAVRVPLNEDCWLGINGVSAAYAGTNYQQAIVAYVDLLLANGIYPIVDLHWNAPGTTLATGQQPMADADHAPAFWTSVAGVFKSQGNVILELYNEPWPDNNQDTTAAWTCWRDGGSCPSVAFPVAGMQTLVDTVRATGAANLLLLGGVEYSNALSQWAAYKPVDPLNNLAAAWHVYEGNTCSDTSCFDDLAAPLADAFPIVATEIGDSSCDGAFMTTVMQWLDAHGQSYSAWTWNAWGAACGNYSLIADYTGTPNGAYGLAYQAHLTAL